jgi:hypothetical protein
MPIEAALTTEAPGKVIDLTQTTTASDLRAVHVEAARLLAELNRQLNNLPDPRVIALAGRDEAGPAAGSDHAADEDR